MSIEQRMQILQILYEERARGSQTLDRDILTQRMNTSWDTLRQEVAYAEENKYIEVKRQRMGARISEKLRLTAKGVDVVEERLDGMQFIEPGGNYLPEHAEMPTKGVAPSLQHKVEAEEFDVYLCYNREDRIAVKKIAEKLREQGILPWFDEWELRPGFPIQRARGTQIRQIKSAAVFVGKTGLGPWHHLETEALLDQFVSRHCPIIPALLMGAPQQPDVPIFLGVMQWVDFREQEPDPMEQLLWGITGKRSMSR